MKEIKWCCSGFEAAYQSGGERGIAAVVDEDEDGTPQVFLQARAFDIGHEPELNTTVPMNLIMEKGLRFCPWCGVSLTKWYRGYVAQIKRPDLRVQEG